MDCRLQVVVMIIHLLPLSGLAGLVTKPYNPRGEKSSRRHVVYNGVSVGITQIYGHNFDLQGPASILWIYLDSAVLPLHLCGMILKGFVCFTWKITDKPQTCCTHDERATIIPALSSSTNIRLLTQKKQKNAW